MEKVRHGKHSNKDKSKKTSKKRKSRGENGQSPNNSSVVTTNAKPLVEYSDVSSEDLSGPEAGEIQSGEESIFSFSDDGELSGHSMHRNSHSHRYAHSSRLEEEYYMARQSLLISHSPTRRVHLDMLSRSPSPLARRERKASVSSRSSLSSEVRHRRKLESPALADYRNMSPAYAEFDEDMDARHKRRKDKRHKKDKKSKKKKKKSRHRSHSTSGESDVSNTTPPRTVKIASPRPEVEREQLSDWEPPVVEQPKLIPEQIDAGACSPVSNDSHIASPEPEERLKSPSPVPITPPLREQFPRESPHTPVLPLKSYNGPLQVSYCVILSVNFNPVK